MDNAKAGSKHHLITNACGIPVATILTGAHARDVAKLVPVAGAIAPVRGKVRPSSLATGP